MTRFAMHVALLSVIVAALAPGMAWSERAAAEAGCGEPTGDASQFIYVAEPAGAAPPVISGEAPFLVSIGILGGVAIFPAGYVSSSFDWGDGASSTVIAIDCGDGEAAWPDQQHPHTYNTPGEYQVTWRIQLIGVDDFDFPFLHITVGVAQEPTPTPTPEPTATPTPLPTPTPAGPTTPTPGGPTPTPGAASPTTTGQSTPAPGGSTVASPTPTPTPRPTPTPTPTPGTAAPGAIATPTAGPPATGALTRFDAAPERPEIARAIKSPSDISTDPGVVATNIVVAGVTVWVLFSSVLLNQVLQSNRAELDQRAARLAAPFRRVRPRRLLPAGRLGAVLGGAILLGATGFIYSLLEPSFGWNAATGVLFLSAVLGVGIVTYASSGFEAFATRRLVRVGAAVRPFPAAIAIALGSVAVSLALDLRPGVMYGFIASCAVLQPVSPTRGESGRISLAPITASLFIAVSAWLLIEPIRALSEDSSGWFPAVLEATAVCVFIGGIEGLLFNMAPLAEMDGARVYRWNRALWLALAATAAFLTWHVLFGRERENFSGLREASSVTVLVVFVVYTILTVGLWAYFRRRQAVAAA